jgi:hypothetical protein
VIEASVPGGSGVGVSYGSDIAARLEQSARRQSSRAPPEEFRSMWFAEQDPLLASAARSRSFEPATHDAPDARPDGTAAPGHIWGMDAWSFGAVPLASAGFSIHTRSARVPNTVLNSSRGSSVQCRCRRTDDRGAPRVFHVKQSSLATRRGDVPPHHPLGESTRIRISAEPRRLCMRGSGSCLHGPPSSRRNHQPGTRQPLRWAVQQAAISTVPSSVRRDP